MICPSCGTNVPEDTIVCPACHADLSATNALPKLLGTYCATCGALVPPGAERCPKCDMPVAPPEGERAGRADVPDGFSDDDPSDQDTHALPRIESSIPSEDEITDSPTRDRLPRLRNIVFAAAASLLIVGGAILAFTHPWAPGNPSTHATGEADTSQAGYPGAVTSLKGQDDASTTANATTSDPVFEAIESDYAQLGDLAKSVDANADAFARSGTAQDLSARVSGKNDADSLATKTSNLISDIDSLQDGDGLYAEDVSHLSTLGNYLRNRLDALDEAWSLSVDASDPAASATSIKAPLARQQDGSGSNTYKTLFDQNYASWKPQQKKG
ncbi:MAG: zinc ribbon domain-containing protein [Atopobiaceae bacterium]|nr:zinc ribbon domain-containing protein [Atopobiaceae bacterium]